MVKKLTEKKMKEKKKHKISIKKCIAGLLIAASITVAPLLTGCVGKTPNPVEPTPPGQEQVIPEYSEYSELLQGVLTNDYYNNLITQAEANRKVLTQAQYANHPYAFLQSEGHNVDAIKNGTLACTTNAFVKDSEPNNLYMATYVENSGDYYTEYLLKYTLTAAEMRDYNLLYDMPENNQYASSAYQAYFINDQVSKVKTPEIVSETKMSTTAHDYIVNDSNFKTLVKTTLGSSSQYNILLTGYNTDESTFNLLIHQTTKSTNTYISNSKIGNAQFIAMDPVAIDSRSVFIGPYTYLNRMLISDEDYLNLKNNTQNISYFINGTNPTYVADLTDTNKTLTFNNALNLNN